MELNVELRHVLNIVMIDRSVLLLLLGLIETLKTTSFNILLADFLGGIKRLLRVPVISWFSIGYSMFLGHIALSHVVIAIGSCVGIVLISDICYLLMLIIFHEFSS